MAAQQPAQPAQPAQAQNQVRRQWDPNNVPHHQGDLWYQTSVDRPYKNRGRTKKEQFYDQIAYHRGMPMPIDKQGPNGSTSTVRINYGPGAEELTRIVAGLQKGVRQVNGTQTLDGAKEWIVKNNKTGWQADEVDITGPGGIPDGINEIIIVDANGNLRVVNGYTLGPSSYAWRRAYYETHPNAASRAHESFGEFKYANTRYDDELDANGNFVYEKDLGQFNKIRGKVKPRNWFRQIFYTPTFKQFKAIIPQNLNTMAKSQLSSQIFNYVWEMLFLNPAIVETDGTVDKATIVTMEEKDYNAAKKSEGTTKKITAMIKEILSDQDGLKQTMLYAQCAHLIAIALNDYYKIQVPDNFQCYGLTGANLKNYQFMADYVKQLANKANIDNAVTNAEGVMSGAYNAEVTRRRNAANTRINVNNASKQAWQALPMYDPAIKKASRAAGWKYYTGQVGQDDDSLLQAIQNMINTRNNRLQQQGQQQAQQQGGQPQGVQQNSVYAILTPQQQNAVATLMRAIPQLNQEQAARTYLAGIGSGQINLDGTIRNPVQQPQQQAQAPVHTGVGPFGAAPGDLGSPPQFNTQQTV